MEGKTLSGAFLLVGALAAAGCSEPLSPDDNREEVAVRFHTAVGSSSQVAVARQGGSLLLSGTNGTLRIDELYVIVDRFELKRADDDRCAEEDHVCERFSTPPMLLDLPLDGSSVLAVRQAVDPDTYRRLRFEIDDLDDDEENPARAQQIRELRSAIRARFADWPRDGSMLVVGAFTPAGGQPAPFRTYFEAEIEIRMPLVPPVTIDPSVGGGTFTVQLDPLLIFGTGGGTVRDLSALDFGRTGLVPELEVEIRNGFSRVEFGR